MVKKTFLLACLFGILFTVPAMGASSKAKLLTDTSSSANTVPYINAAPAEDSTAATALGVQVNGTEMMRVTASGNVGIGTASPNAPLSVSGSGSSGPLMEIKSTSTGWNYISFINNGTRRATIGTDANNNASLYGDGDSSIWAGAGERIRITATGNVGIGTTSPSVALDIASSIPLIRLAGSSNDVQLRLVNSGTSGRAYSVGSGLAGAGAGLGFYVWDETAGVGRLKIDSAGNVGIGTTSPAYKLDVAGSARVQTGNTLYADIFGANWSNSNGGTVTSGGTLTATTQFGSGTVTCVDNGGSGIVDCYCPTGYIAISGGPWLVSGSIRESRPMLEVTGRAWRTSCLSTSGTQLYCAGGSITCARFQPN